MRRNHANFHSRWLCNKNTNKLKYNFSGRVSLLQVATVTGISTNWFELRRVIFPGIFPTGVYWRIGSSLREFRIIEGSRNRG